VHGGEKLLYTATIAGVEYGIDAPHVAGTFEISRLYPVPGASVDVLGLHAWKGTPIPVVDPRSHLGELSRHGDMGRQFWAVVVRSAGLHIAIAVDRVVGPLAYSGAPRRMLDLASLLGNREDSRGRDARAGLRAALWKHASFAVTDVNIDWVTRRRRSAKKGRVSPSTPKLATGFLASFGSPCIDTLWNESLRGALRALVPGSSSRSFAIWNHGCGRGYDALSVACILALDRPRWRVTIWAVDELAAIVEAQNSTLSRSDVPDYLKRSGLVAEEEGHLSAVESIRNKILFVCSDAFVPFSESFDMIICRDRLSYMDAHAQAAAIDAFSRALRPAGTLITGVHERMPARQWSEQRLGDLPSWKVRGVMS
jgi:SAM-dependent methyltransferase